MMMSFDEHCTQHHMSRRLKIVPALTRYRDGANDGGKVVGLYLYPVKACQPISLQKTKLDSAGFQLDRAFCIVDINGDRYVGKQAPSQRLLPAWLV